MKKLALGLLLFANTPSTHAFLFFFFKSKKTDFEKAIQDIEKIDPSKLEKDTYNLEDPHDHDFKALTYILENKQRELEKEKKKNDEAVQAALLWLAALTIEVAQIVENSYEAFNRDHNLKEKDRAYRDMKIIVHDAEVSRLKKKKTIIEEKYEIKQTEK